MTDRSIHADLVAALGELEDLTATKTADAGTYSYKYAGLDDLLRLVRPVLARHDLAVAQSVTGIPGQDIAVETRLYHARGDCIVFGPLALKAGATPQTAGSAISYARRYALMAALGLATEDDDGAGASRAAAEQQQTATSRTRDEAAIRSMLEPLEAEQRKQLQVAFRERFGCGLSDLDPSDHGAARMWVEDELRSPLTKAVEAEAEVRPATRGQLTAIFALLGQLEKAGVLRKDEDRHVYLSYLLGLDQIISSFNDLTEPQAEAARQRLLTLIRQAAGPDPSEEEGKLL